MRIPFQYSIIASAVILAGCGGGGGGPSGNVNTVVRDSVSYATPQQINHYTPLTGTGINAPVHDVFTKDLNNDNSDEVVVGGRLTQPATPATWRNTNMQVYGWNTGSFTNETTSWFSGSDNTIVGSEPSIKFADFNGDGNVDMFVSPSTDMATLAGDPIVFTNTGNNSFIKSTLSLPDIWAHDSWVGDINNDGYADIVMSDNISSAFSVSYGSAAGTFTSYTTGGVGVAGTAGTTSAAGISVADYLGDGTKTMVLTDAASNVSSDTKLYSFDTSGGSLSLTELATLPQSRFLLPKWSNVYANRNNDPHAIRNFDIDINNDGLQDVVIMEIIFANGESYSELQFLQNNGGGSFTDVTDSVLVDYDTDFQGSYNPTMVDINNDGLDDILLSAQGVVEGDIHAATKVILQTSDGKFVQKFDDVFTDFYRQVYNKTSNALDWGQTISVVNGPDNEKYLFTTVLYSDNGNVQSATYLAKIGSTGTVAAQSMADVLQSVWPYLSDTSTNEVLAKTAPLSIDGTPVVDMDSALQPVGDLSVNNVRISGDISVAGLNNSVFSNVTALDDVGRNYTVDITPLASNNKMKIDAVVDTRTQGVTAFGDNIEYSFGTDSSLVSDSTWRWGLGVNRSADNPWLHFSGMFGTVNSSTTVELDISKEYANGVWHRAGIMQTKTDFSPGLVTDVSDLYAGYGVFGYKQDGLNLYGGIKPTLFSGSIGVRLPTSVDSSGNLQYTNYSLDVRNNPVKFFGMNYNFVLDITKQLNWNINAQVDSEGNKQGNISAGLPW